MKLELYLNTIYCVNINALNQKNIVTRLFFFRSNFTSLNPFNRLLVVTIFEHRQPNFFYSILDFLNMNHYAKIQPNPSICS